ncbi:MAG: Sugar-binding protein, partial [Chloroflexota bacterium]|nr:Sugar-binding protein [Chloroflexota bacterium]
MKKLLTVAFMAGALVVAACGGSTATTAPAASEAPAATEAPAASEAPAESMAPAAGGLVGIAMPTKSSARWIADGDNLVKSLQAAGYETDLQYAEDDIPTQLNQVENMITKGAKALVIAAIDGTTLADTLQKAADAGIKVFAYDRLIRESPNVDYYAAFDNFDVGVAQAGSIVDSLDLNNAAGPFNIELFAGSPDDNNAGFFFNGAMSILQPFIDSGKLVVQSGETKFPEQVGTLRWSGDAAQARMDNILASKYADKRVDAVLSPYDGISRGII